MPRPRKPKTYNPELTKEEYVSRFNRALDIFGIADKNQGRSLIVADIFKLTQRGASRWVNGEVLPPRSKRKEIAATLGVSYDWLEYDRGNPYASDGNEKILNIPTLSLEQAARYHVDGLDQISSKITVEMATGEHSFGIRATGTLVSNIFPDNALLVVDPQREPKHNDYVLATYRTVPEALLRQYCLTETGSILRSLREGQRDIAVDDNVQMTGVISNCLIHYT